MWAGGRRGEEGAEGREDMAKKGALELLVKTGFICKENHFSCEKTEFTEASS